MWGTLLTYTISSAERYIRNGTLPEVVSMKKGVLFGLRDVISGWERHSRRGKLHEEGLLIEGGEVT